MKKPIKNGRVVMAVDDYKMDILVESEFSAEELALAAAGVLRLPEESEVSTLVLKEKRSALKSETAIKAIAAERDGY